MLENTVKPYKDGTMKINRGKYMFKGKSLDFKTFQKFPGNYKKTH